MPQPTAYGDRPLRVPDSNPLIQGVDPAGLSRFLSLDANGLLSGIGVSSTGVITNLCLNPSFGNGVAGVSSVSSSYLTPLATFVQSSAQAFFGSFSLLVTTNDQGGHAPGVTVMCQSPFKAGVTYNCSLQVRGVAGGEVIAVFLGDETSGDVAGPTIVNAVSTGWLQANVSWTPTADRATPEVVIRTTTTNQYYVDAIMVTNGPLPTDFFDGDSPGASWTGPIGDSTSITGGGLLPDVTGTWDYRAGISGSPRSFSGRVLGISAHSTSGGSMTINGGDTIPVPANSAIQWEPLAQLVSPTLVFTGTDGYVVEFVN